MAQYLGSLSEDARQKAISGLDSLTAREAEVFELIAEGLTAKAAARMLGISHRTVEVHRARAVAKLGARNAVEAVRIVFHLRTEQNMGNSTGDIV